MAGEPELHPNQSNDGEWVAYLQHHLNVPVTREYDDATVAAVRNAQYGANLEQTGVTDAATWAAIVGAGQHVAAAHHAEQQPLPNHARVWVKAFIPSWVEGAIDGKGPSSGKKVIRGPIPGVSDCFYTDNRDYSHDPRASGRLNVDVVIGLRDGSLVSQHVWSDATHECDCEDGEIECEMTATPTSAVSAPRRDGNTLVVDFSAAASNPCVTGSPDADVNGSIHIDLAHRTLTLTGNIDTFPAYEAYCDFDGTGTATLWQEGPSGGPGTLVGNASRPQSGSAHF